MASRDFLVDWSMILYVHHANLLWGFLKKVPGGAIASVSPARVECPQSTEASLSELKDTKFGEFSSLQRAKTLLLCT